MGDNKRLKFYNWYEAHIERWIPSYALLSLIGCLVWNCMIYWGTQQTILGLGLHTHDITSAIDLMVPFRPEWVLIYVLSFPFWAVSYILTAKENTREDWFRFVFADMLAKAICGVIFIAFPTTNVRPDIDGSGILGSLMGLIYFLDPPLDLFPSIHCLVSLLSWLGIRKCSNIPQWYRNFTLIFAIMIFASTQFTKQHYLADVIAGIVIALGCYFISRHCSGYKAVERFFGRMSSKLFGNEIKVHDVEK